jgi:hypothetical protein
LLSSGIAVAQTPPEPAPPPTTPADPAAPVDTTQPAGAPSEPAPMAPAEVVEPAKDDKPPLAVTYDGGTKFSSGDDQFELRLLFRNQLRFQSTRSLEDGEEFENQMLIPRSRFQVEGHIFGKDTRYKLELGLGDQGSFSFIKDMFVDQKLGESPVYFRAGQWKRPFNRAEIVSDFGSTFNERSIQNELAGGGRSLGVAAHNDYEKAPTGLEWVVGVFNTFSGGGDRPGIAAACEEDLMAMTIDCVVSRPTTVPADFGPTIVARAGWNSEKSKGYTESDLEGGPLRYAVGAAYKVDLANFDGSDAMSHGVEVDANVKVNGFSVTGGAVLMKIQDADPAYGFYVQPAFFVVPKKMEVAGRFAMVLQQEEDMGVTADVNVIEGRAAFNYYLQGHTFKVASDAGFLKLGGDISGDPELQLRVMLQLSI